MSLADRHIAELKAARWRDLDAVRARWEARLGADPDGFLAAARRAAADHDNLAVVAVGQLLQWREDVSGKLLHEIRLAATLLEEQRHQEALDLLESSAMSNPAHPKYWTMKARALAGLGRLKEGHRDVREALRLRPGHREAVALESALRKVIKLRKRFREGGYFSWRDLRRVVEGCRALDQPEEAAALLRRSLARFQPIRPEDVDDALEVVDAAVELVGPEAALGYAELAGFKGAACRRLQGIAARCLVELGRADEVLGEDEGGWELRRQRALALAARGDLDPAIERLGRMTEEGRKEPAAREALAWCVGEHVLLQTPLIFGPSAPTPRIFNLVPFNDELELLQIHLAEMAEWVDLFVIVESTVTFTGRPKPLHFERRRADFEPYAHKIRHVVVDRHPPAFASPWSRDFRQRDLAVSALSGICGPDDLVLLTDVDEVVDRHALEGFDGDLAGLRMAMFRYFLNYRPDPDNQPWRPTGAVVRARHLQRFGSSYIRFFLARRRNGHMLSRAGWHFTSVGDSRRMVAKMNSYAHQERMAEWRDEDRVGQLLASIRAGELEPGWERAKIDDSFPRFIREHPDAFRDLTI